VLNSIRLKTAIAASVGTAAALFATPAAAGSQNANLGVSATVNAKCTISTTALAFGSIDTLSASAVTGTGGVAIACTNGSTWTATADAGTGAGATFASRRMTSGANTLSYSLFTDAGRTTVWGDGTNSSGVITSTGTGTAQNITIYGQIPGSQTGVPAGSYADTVAVTVTY
jgi:spore coat protein U-like protein